MTAPGRAADRRPGGAAPSAPKRLETSIARSSLLALIAVVAVAIVAAWSLRSWEWSLVDDADYKINLVEAQRQQGWFDGILARVQAGYQGDRAGGQFRPLLWVYSATFYLLGPQPAHAFRLLLVLFSVGSVGVAVARRLSDRVPRTTAWLWVGWSMLAVAAIRGLYDGLSFLSVMELPTIAFAAAALVDRSAARKVLWLTLASLCKSPILGGLFVLSVVLLRQGRRGLAATAAASGATIFLFARDFALGGSYTTRYVLTPDHAMETVYGLGKQLAIPTLVLGCALLWRPSRPRFDPDAVVLGSAGLGYAALLLPWGSSSGYNLAVPAFLLVAATTLVIARALSDRWSEPAGTASPGPARLPTRQLVLPFALALGLAAFVGTVGVRAAIDRDATIRYVVAWADELPDTDIVATNGVESSVRYAQLIALRHEGVLSQEFAYAEPGAPLPCGTTWVVAMHDQGPYSSPQRLRLVRSLPKGEIYRVPGGVRQGVSC